MIEFERSRVQAKVGEIIALIDIALFLLIFFMVAGSIEKFELIPIEVPEAESSHLLDEGHIVILLGTHDEIVLGDELITLPELQERLQEQLEGNPNKIITLKADASIPAVKMMAIMDAIKLAGGDHLSLVTRSAKKEEGGS